MFWQKCIAFNILADYSLINESTVRDGLLEYFLTANYVYFWFLVYELCHLQCFIKTSCSLNELSFVYFCVLRNDDVRSIWKSFFTDGIEGFTAHDDCIFLCTGSGDFLEHFEVAGKFPRDLIVEPDTPVDRSCNYEVKWNLAGIHFSEYFIF